jgi:hypothetical protein
VRRSLTASPLLALALVTACATTGAAPASDPLAGCKREVPDADTWLCDGWKLEFHAAADLEAEAEVVLQRAEKRAAHSGLAGGTFARADVGDAGTRLSSAEAPLLEVYRLDGVRGPLLLTCTYSVVQPTDACREVALLLRDYDGRVGYWLKPAPVD